MLVRRETPDDIDAIAAVTTAAFGRVAEPGVPPETELLGHLRTGGEWLSPLSLVAELDGEVIGHVVCTRGFLEDAPALGLGPISVLPAHQRRGVGEALMHAVLGAAEALEEPLVCLVGDPHFYSRFGFVTAESLGIGAPDPSWGVAFQARPLSRSGPIPTGTFRYARAFAELGLG